MSQARLGASTWLSLAATWPPGWVQGRFCIPTVCYAPWALLRLTLGVSLRGTWRVMKRFCGSAFLPFDGLFCLNSDPLAGRFLQLALAWAFGLHGRSFLAAG